MHPLFFIWPINFYWLHGWCQNKSSSNWTVRKLGAVSAAILDCLSAHTCVLVGMVDARRVSSAILASPLSRARPSVCAPKNPFLGFLSNSGIRRISTPLELPVHSFINPPSRGARVRDSEAVLMVRRRIEEEAERRIRGIYKGMVDARRVELLTPTMPSWCSTS